MNYNFKNAIKTENLKFVNKVNGNGEIEITGQIGDSFFSLGYTFEDFKNDLSEIKGDILIKISSFGGDLFEALAIYDYIRSLENTVTTRIIKATASAGTIISLAGDKREITKNSRYLIHQVMVEIGMANKKDLLAIINDLDSFDKQIINLYVENSKLNETEVLELMEQDKFISAEKAIELGFIDSFANSKTRAGEAEEKPTKKEINKKPENKIKNDMSKLFEILNVKNEDEAIKKVATLQNEAPEEEEDKDKIIEDLKQKLEEAGEKEKEKENEEDPEKEKEKENEEDPEEAPEELTEEEKDALIEELKQVVEDLKKQLEEKEVEEAENKVNQVENFVDELIKNEKLNENVKSYWMDIGIEKGLDILETLTNSIPEVKQSVKGKKESTLLNNVKGPKAFDAKQAFKNGEMTLSEYTNYLEKNKK